MTSCDYFSTAAFVREHDCKRHELTHTATRNFTCLWYVSLAVVQIRPRLSLFLADVLLHGRMHSGAIRRRDIVA